MFEDAPAEVVEVEDREASGLTADELKMLDMEKLAKNALNEGLVPFYGCSRCRFARGGCISWNCNPEKFKAHLEQFPEKYEGKMLKLLVTDKELVGGGGDRVYKVITSVS